MISVNIKSGIPVIIDVKSCWITHIFRLSNSSPSVISQPIKSNVFFDFEKI